jgi:exonuclease III
MNAKTKMLNWNTRNASRKSIPRLFSYIDEQDADLIVLSEVNFGVIDLWSEQFDVRGYKLIAHEHPVENRRGSLIASRLPASPTDIHYPHKGDPQVTVSAEITMLEKVVTVHAVYAPPDGSRINGVTTVKPSILQTVSDVVSKLQGPQFVAGDFNAPQAEYEDGTWITWAEEFSESKNQWYVSNGPVHGKFFAKKHKAESSISKPRYDMSCAFRNSMVEGSPESSWHGRKNKFRLDHIIASQDIMPTKVWYDEFHDGFDHRPMLAEWV